MKLPVAWALASATLVPRLAHADPPSEPDVASICGASTWRLDGAPWDASKNAAFNPEWQKVLDQVNACVAKTELARACIAVQGQYDKFKFSAPLDKEDIAYGGQQAAQIARARGRAGVVLSRLNQMGVQPWRLQEVPPPFEPTFRGVDIAVVTTCMPPSEVAPPIPTEPEPEPEPTAPSSNVVVTAVVPREEWHPGPFWPIFGAVADGTFASDDDAHFGSILWAGVEYRKGLGYGGARLGFGIGADDARRAALEARLDAGIDIDWVQVGVYGQVGQSGTGATDPWLERTWSVGIEGAQCADKSLLPFLGEHRICLSERFAPLGQRTLRGVVVEGSTYFLPPETDWLLRAELGLELRLGL